MGSVTVVVIEELGDSRYILRCARCNGTGRYIHDTSYECRTCGGRGVVMVEIVGGGPPFVKCARCNGTGRYIHDTSYECKSCHGVGAQPVCGDMKILK
jgi:DnaJ-class molecular chaperone